MPSDSDPRSEPELTFAGEDPVAKVQYRPQPLRVWTFDLTPEDEERDASAPSDERLTLTSTEGVDLELEVAGILEVAFEEIREVRLELTVGGIAACPGEMGITFEDDEEHDPDDGAPGEIRCGERLLAVLIPAPGGVEVNWVE